MPRYLQVKTYDILERAVQEGTLLGWRRAFKHTDTPDEDTACATIEAAVMNAICEVFEFDEPADRT